MDPTGDPGQGPSSNLSNPEILLTNMSGNHIITFLKTTLSAARELTREALANQGKTNVWFELYHNRQRIIDEEQFTHVTDGIQCVLVSVSVKAKFDAEDSFTRYTENLRQIDQIDWWGIRREIHELHQRLKDLLDNYSNTISQQDFDTYKTTLLKRYAELICYHIITKEGDDDHSGLLGIMEYVKEKYNINFTIPVTTDTNNPATILALEQFKTIVQEAFDSVNSNDTLRTEITKVRDFLDEYKGVLDYTQTRQVIVAASRNLTGPNGYQIIFNNKALDLQYLYTKLLK